MNLSIRPVRASDAEQVAEIWNEVIRNSTHTFTTVEKDPVALVQQFDETPFFVAEEDELVVGFVTYSQFRSGPGYARTVEHSVYLAPETRGKGIGRALLSHAENHAKAAGVHCFIAGLAAENEGAAAFHEALGYVDCGRLREVGYKFGRWHDLIFMQKVL